jgi:hypothetical protein
VRKTITRNFYINQLGFQEWGNAVLMGIWWCKKTALKFIFEFATINAVKITQGLHSGAGYWKRL